MSCFAMLTSICRNIFSHFDFFLFYVCFLIYNPKNLGKAEAADHERIVQQLNNEQTSDDWKEVPQALKENVCPKLPWLLLPQDPNCINKMKFFDMSVGQVHSLNLPKQLHGAVCLGSSKGWLVMCKETHQYPVLNKIFSLFFHPIPITIIFLLNPTSGALYHLPSFLNMPMFIDNFVHTELAYNISSFVQTIQLSSTDITECIVGGIFGSGELIAFCRPGDDRWSVYPNPELDVYVDMLFHDGAFNVLTTNNFGMETMNVALSTIGLKNSQELVKLIPYFEPNVLQVRHPVVEAWDGHKILRNDYGYSYLIQSANGELWLIRETLDVFLGYDSIDDDFDVDESYSYHEFVYFKTSGFNIHKINPNNGSLSKLSDMSGQVIFLMRGNSLAVSTSDAASIEGIQANSIYFVNNVDAYIDQKYTPLVLRESGVYYLDEGRFERSIPSFVIPMQSKMSWFTPIL